MRKIILLSTAVLLSFTAFSQDFSNKGKDFWLGYGYHERMSGGGNSQDMVLYFATDTATNITISIPSNGYTQTLSTPNGNNVITSAAIPKAGAQDARLINEGTSNNGIHVTSDRPMVAYAHIYNNSVSGASILFPTNTLGKEYYSINFTNISNVPQANCWFYVVAADTGTTTVEITPTAVTSGGWPIGVPQTVNLTQGQIYFVKTNYIGSPTGVDDLTGSKIRTISSGAGQCKRIGVFSGSGRISITCTGGSSSSDNYMVQAFPKAAWGKKFLTATGAGANQFNYYRICVSDPTTIVKVNGVVTALPLQRNFFYEISATSNNAPLLIEGDKPITVAQYFTSQGACGNTGNTDPEVIYLSPVEQTINKVLWNATGNFNILNHYFNVVIKNTGTALTSFKLFNAAGTQLPINPFITHPQDPSYSYLKQPLTAGAGFYRITSDSGFNAIAYGYGNAESYGYNAGTNIKDLNTKLEINNPNTDPSETSPVACTGSPFQLKVYFADSTNSLTALRYDSMKWDVIPNGTATAANFIPNNFPVMVRPVPPATKIAPDSTNIRFGKPVAWYSLPGFYTVTAPGTYKIKITLYNSGGGASECGSESDYDFELVVSDPPTASFNPTLPGCYLEPLVLTETTPQVPKATYKWWWEVTELPPGPPNTTIYTTRNVNTPGHIFTRPGPKRIRHASITTPGCLSDTIVQDIIVPDIPSGTISGTTSVCTNAANPNITVNMVDGRAPYRFTYTINGVAQPPIVSPTATYQISVPTTTPGTYVYALTEVRNDGSTVCVKTITGQTATIIVRPLPNAALAGTTTACLNSAPPPVVTFTGSNATAPYTFDYTINGVAQTPIVSNAAGVATVNAPTNVVGTFVYAITQVTDASSNTCTKAISGVSTTVTIQDLPNATIASSNTAACLNAASPVITFTGSGGTAPYTFTYKLNGLVQPTIVSNAAGIATINVPTTTATTYTYEIVNVKEGSSQGCAKNITNQTSVVTINPLPNAAIAGATTVCLNSAPPPVVTFTGSGSTAPYTFAYTINGVAQTPIVSDATTGIATINAPTNVVGTFTYTITQITDATATACTRTVNLSTIITIQDLPNATIASSTAAACLNSAPAPTVTFTGNTGTAPYIFTYTINGVTQPTVVSNAAGVATINVPTNVATTYTYDLVGVSESSPQACARGSITGQSRVVVINPLPTATAAANILQACVNATSPVVTFTGSGATAPYTFTYTINGVLQPTIVSNAAGVATINVSTTTANVYTYQLVSVRDASSTACSQNQNGSVVVTINALPTASFTVSTPTCETRTTTFTNTSNPNAASATWAWDFGDPINSTPTNPNTSTTLTGSHIYSVAGAYTVTLIATNSNGCISNPIASQVINVNYRPKAGFIVPEVCINDVATVFTDTSKVTAPDVIVRTQNLWNYGDPGSGPLNNSIGQNGSHLYPSPNVYTVRQIVKSDKGCVDTTFLPITINSADPNANFNIQNINTLCSSDSVPLVNLSTVGFGNITKLEIYWDNVGAPAVFQTIDDPVFNGVYRHKYPTLQTNRNYVIRMIAYSGNICFMQKTLPITVYANPKVQFNAIPNTCLLVAPFQITQGSEIGGVPGAGTYSGVGITNANGTFNPQIAGVGTHVIKYTWTATNPGACIDTLTRTITVLDTASSNFSFVSPTCDGQAVTFRDESAPNGTSLQTIYWDFGHVPPNNTATSFPGGTLTHTFPTYGNFDVKVYTETNVGCLSKPKTIRVYVSPIPNPAFAFDKGSYCLPSDSKVRFLNNSNIVDNSALSYTWDFGDPNATPSNPNTSTAFSPTHTYTSTGPFTIKLTATSASGCAKSIDLPRLVTVHPQPKAQFKPNKEALCIGDDVTFTDLTDPTSGATTVQWYWSPLGDGVFTQTNVNHFNHTYVTTGIYAPTMYNVNSFGCHSDTLPIPYIVNAYPEVFAGEDKKVLEYGTVFLNPTVNGTDLKYLWTPNIYLNNNSIKKPTASSIRNDVTYKLSVTGTGGCTRTDEVNIKVLRDLKIPNTFTPNNDGINDVWRIEYLDSYPNCKVQVFTRLGQLVFESIGYGKPWDGTLKGKSLPFDTYYYIIEPESGRDPVKGYVTIVK